MSAPDQKRDIRKALTCIHQRIHWAATDEPEPDENFVGELDGIQINDFINTLAEVAMAVATRRLTRKKDAA